MMTSSTNSMQSERLTRLIGDIPWIWDENLFHRFLERAETKTWDHWELFKLAYEAELTQVSPSFDELLCLEHLPAIIPYPHQIATAKQVLNELHGRAILADEVGLGKTIEAGLILKEYMIRGLVKKALILTPASLVLQWTRELNEKFNIRAFAQRNEWSWNTYDVVVASIDTTKREPHRKHVLEQNWDMLIVDEAHKLKNRKSKNWEIVNQIHKKYLLLLTATPVQNDLKELYNLINLLKPGQLGSVQQFKSSFVEEKRKPKNSQAFKQALSEVMIRNKRSEGGVFFTKRHVQAIPLELSEQERQLYEKVSRFVKEEYVKRRTARGNVLPLITLQREICSSPYAALNTLEKMYKDELTTIELKREIEELYSLCESIPLDQYTKGQYAVELVKKLGDKVIIFTEYRATQDYLMYMLDQSGIGATPFRGGFKRGKKDWMKDLFQKRTQVLVATEAGGEGINLQFCNQIINFDLPWNPMRVEQRIGRVHRLGQTRDVFVYNFATKGTIEEYIVDLLQEKIRMFELVIGELDMIIGKTKTAKTLEMDIMDLLVNARSSDELQSKFDSLGQTLLAAHQRLIHEKIQGEDISIT
ncbi:putative ATP-dependent helicase YqhH [Collibacillus ludicampi]|jgi:SNF2 family DNA or RNA helicase|uniref:ATP-dependent helicase YqhH n=1 Tax=Collibacillus ludicampi TaxID=2771369 RepID=A0AAV4LA27_9BACL|nr:SNF2-related protein [Collibacillus ludicampi]GIM44576.1 putative ATP-dependent helicase YqhH [Collibacillus ludicampi]